MCAVISTFLNTCMDRIIKEAHLENENLLHNKQEGRSNKQLIQRTDISQTMRAFFNEDKEQLQQHINSLVTNCRKYNIKFNNKKTEAMKINKTLSPLNKLLL